MPTNKLGYFLQTTSVLDISHIDIQPESFKDFLVKLVRIVGDIEKIINVKDTGVYSLTEYVCGKTFFPSSLAPAFTYVNSTTQPRQVFRKEFLLALPGGLLMGDNLIAHGLNINLPAQSIWSMTDITGTTNDITNREYYPLPYVDPAGNNISLWVDNANIHVNSAIARPNFTLTYCCLEYLKA